MIKKIIIWFIAVIHGSKNADQYLNKITIMILWYDMGGGGNHTLTFIVTLKDTHAISNQVLEVSWG